MTTNQRPASKNVRRLKFSLWWLMGIGILLVGALLIFAASRNVPPSPIASTSTLRLRITGLRSEHFDAAAQRVLDDLRAYPTDFTNFPSTDKTNDVKRLLERDTKTSTLPINTATERVLEFLRTHPTFPTAPILRYHIPN